MSAFSSDSAGARRQHLLQRFAAFPGQVELAVACISGFCPAYHKRYRFIADVRGHDQWRGGNLRAELSFEPPRGVAQEISDAQRCVGRVAGRSRAGVEDVILPSDQKTDLRESGGKGRLVKSQADEHCGFTDQRTVVRPRIRPRGTARVLRGQRRAELSATLPRCSRSHPDEGLPQRLRAGQVLDVNVPAIVGPARSALPLADNVDRRSTAQVCERDRTRPAEDLTDDFRHLEYPVQRAVCRYVYDVDLVARGQVRNVRRQRHCHDTVSIAHNAGNTNGLLDGRERRATARDRSRNGITGPRARRNSRGIDLDSLLIEKESIDGMAGVGREHNDHVQHLVLIAPRMNVDQSASGSHLPVANLPRRD